MNAALIQYYVMIVFLVGINYYCYEWINVALATIWIYWKNWNNSWEKLVLWQIMGFFDKWNCSNE